MISTDQYIIEPFLHFSDHKIYNPLTDLSISRKDMLADTLLKIKVRNRIDQSLMEAGTLSVLLKDGWIVPSDKALLTRYRLKYVSLEATAHCNQRCYFCPVSLDPKTVHTMSLNDYEDIVKQIANYTHLEGVFINNYNEPTVDKYFVDRIRILKKYGLPIGLNTNGSGLTPQKVDEIVALGGVGYLAVNLSTIEKEEYERSRGFGRLDLILRNLDYLKSMPVAEKMVVAVMGEKDSQHEKNFFQICDYFEGSRFLVKSYQITNRAGCLDQGQEVEQTIKHLGGCDLMGSRLLQHIHINSYGKVLMCCQDYFEEYTVGDLKVQSVEEVLVSKKMQELRAMNYGIKEAPDDFICRKCVFALSCDNSFVHAG